MQHYIDYTSINVVGCKACRRKIFNNVTKLNNVYTHDHYRISRFAYDSILQTYSAIIVHGNLR